MNLLRVALVQASRTGLAVIVVAVLATYAFVLLGGSAHVITSASMQPALQVGDVLLARPSDGQLNVGQIVLVGPESRARPLSHRVVEVRADSLVTMGDAGQDADPPVPLGWVKGEGVAGMPWIGLPAVWLRERNVPALAGFLVVLGLLTGAATRPLSVQSSPS